MFESESNWSEHNKNLIDYVQENNKKKGMPNELSKCITCGNISQNPSSDHYFYAENMLLCELCYLDYQLMKNN